MFFRLLAIYQHAIHIHTNLFTDITHIDAELKHHVHALTIALTIQMAVVAEQWRHIHPESHQERRKTKLDLWETVRETQQDKLQRV